MHDDWIDLPLDARNTAFTDHARIAMRVNAHPDNTRICGDTDPFSAVCMAGIHWIANAGGLAIAGIDALTFGGDVYIKACCGFCGICTVDTASISAIIQVLRIGNVDKTWDQN